MNDEQLQRYSRQIMLPEFDYQGQQSLLSARVLIIGLGGLGSPVALYLAAAGVGTLVLADDDVVDPSNLQRQIIHGEADVGQSKVASAAHSITALNSDVLVKVLQQRLNGDALSEEVKKADIVLDCCDNLSTRLAVNKACLQHQTPLVSGAAMRMEGQVTVVDPRQPNTPCYHCLMQFTGEQEQSCASSGVMAPLVGIIGATQAMEAIKVVSKFGQPLVGKLLLLDAKTMQWQTFALPKDASCPSCGII
ncbi:MAG: molybdopterin/thiamine biosynthesis adenylyltransferase [Saprospiraceae bacterium]|jgi:molybdopterin/thiamine biosynthesis adenylyltransferase|tara:strand:- start:110 stop:856 length:747 start_codon:yes stop_codon:yes gene_type:complete